MRYRTPLKDFFVKAVMYAKQNKVQELNKLEGKLIIAEEELIGLKKKGKTPPKIMNSFESKVNGLKSTIKSKKKEVYES
ncbi:hypothetical protein KY348_04630 [Candidatus Woesearchaeota archaeon]|nr:hypothetical protein [Candidatus Woesearchaeota archaeon]